MDPARDRSVDHGVGAIGDVDATNVGFDPCRQVMADIIRLPRPRAGSHVYRWLSTRYLILLGMLA